MATLKVDWTDKKILENVTLLVSQGYTESSIAKYYDYAPTHFCALKKQFPEIAEYIKAGKNSVEQLCRNKLFEMMINDNHPKQFSATVFLLKTQHGYSETAKSEVTVTERTTGFKFTKDGS